MSKYIRVSDYPLFLSGGLAITLGGWDEFKRAYMGDNKFQ